MKQDIEYEVKIDVFFMVTRYVQARNKKEAIEKAKNKVNYGEGEELTIFEVRRT